LVGKEVAAAAAAVALRHAIRAVRKVTFRGTARPGVLAVLLIRRATRVAKVATFHVIVHLAAAAAAAAAAGSALAANLATRVVE
jgi:hypothetical protein